MKTITQQAPKWLISLYFFWLTINMAFLLIGSKSDYSQYYFIPFSREGVSISKNYDLTEFIFYGFSPILLYLSYYFGLLAYKSKKEKDESFSRALGWVLILYNELYKNDMLNLVHNVASYKMEDGLLKLQLNSLYELLLSKAQKKDYEEVIFKYVPVDYEYTIYFGLRGGIWQFYYETN